MGSVTRMTLQMIDQDQGMVKLSSSPSPFPLGILRQFPSVCSDTSEENALTLA
jgi:hypothetical protein